MVANSRFSGWVMVVAMVSVLAAVSFTFALAQEATPSATEEPQVTGTEQPAAEEAMPGAPAGDAGQVGEALPTLGAGGEEAPVELPPQGYLIETFQKGGVFMWPLLICSIIGLAVIIERAWTFSRAKVNTRQFMSKVIGALKEDGLARRHRGVSADARPHRRHPARRPDARAQGTGRGGEGDRERRRHRDVLPAAGAHHPDLGRERRPDAGLPRHGVGHDPRLRGHRRRRAGEREAGGERDLRGPDHHPGRSGHRHSGADRRQLLHLQHRPLRARHGRGVGGAG